MELSLHYMSDGIQTALKLPTDCRCDLSGAALKLPTDCRCDLSGAECTLPVWWHSGSSQAPNWLQVWPQWSWVCTSCLMAFRQLSSSQLTAGVTSVELSVHYLSDGIQAALKLPTDCRCDLSGAECALPVWWHSGSSQAPNWLQVWPQWSWVCTTCLMAFSSSQAPNWLQVWPQWGWVCTTCLRAFRQLSSSQLTWGVTSVELSVHYLSDGIQAALKLPTDYRCYLSGAECALPVWWHSAALKLPTDCRCDLSGAECALPVWGHSGSSQAPNWLEVWPQWSWVYTTCLMAFKQLSSSQLTTGVISVGLSAHYLSEGIQAALKLPTDCRCDLSGAECTLPVWWHSSSSQAPNWLQVLPQWGWVRTTCLRAFRQLSSSQLTAGVTSVELSVHYLSDGIQAALKLPTDLRCDLSGAEWTLPVWWHSGSSQAPNWLQMRPQWCWVDTTCLMAFSSSQAPNWLQVWPQWGWVCTTCLRAFRQLSSSQLTAGVTSVELSVHYPSDGIQAALKLPTDCRCDLSGAECTLPVWWHSGSSQAPNWLQVWPQWSWVCTTCWMAFRHLSSSHLTADVTSVELSVHYLSEGIQAPLKLPSDCRLLWKPETHRWRSQGLIYHHWQICRQL